MNTASLQESEEEKEIASVPVDDEQPRCALSGEKFEKFWHDDHQVHCNTMHSCLVQSLRCLSNGCYMNQICTMAFAGVALQACGANQCRGCCKAWLARRRPRIREHACSNPKQ